MCYTTSMILNYTTHCTTSAQAVAEKLKAMKLHAACKRYMNMELVCKGEIGYQILDA